MARRTKEESLQTRNALLDAAEAVFEARGVSAASLQEVAAAAGVTRGAVYWHFRDKADLFNAMMDRAILPFEQHWQMVSADEACDPLQRLRQLLVDILGRVATDERLQRALAISTQKLEYVDGLDSIRERSLRVRREAITRFEGLLIAAASAGQLAPRVRPQIAARALHAMVNGLITSWMLERSAFDLAEVGGAAVDLLLAGLCARQRVQPPARLAL